MDFTKIGTPVLISSKSKIYFSEGPVWDKAHNVFLFSDRDGNKLYQLALPNTVTLYKDPGNKTYSMIFDKDGSLISAEWGTRSVVRTLADGTRKVLADKYQSKALNGPNKMIMRDDGTIYFTDPYFSPPSPVGVTFMGLYRLTPAGELVLEGQYSIPNGVGLSPDQKTLYMTLTMSNQVMSFSVAADGSTSNGKKFLSGTATAEGIQVDAAGNIWIACQDGVYVYSPEGTKLAYIKITSGRPTSMGFGGPDGKTLMVATDNGNIYTVALP